MIMKRKVVSVCGLSCLVLALSSCVGGLDSDYPYNDNLTVGYNNSGYGMMYDQPPVVVGSRWTNPNPQPKPAIPIVPQTGATIQAPATAAPRNTGFAGGMDTGPVRFNDTMPVEKKVPSAAGRFRIR